MKQLTVIACLFGLFLHAQTPTYNPENSKGELFEYAEFIDVGDKDLELEELQNNHSYHYQPLESDNHSVGFTTSNYWVRFKLENSSNRLKTYYLETARPITDVAELYQLKPNGSQFFESGDQIPFENRQVEHRSTVFKVDLEEGSVNEFYLHFSSDGETINLPLTLYSEADFWQTNYKQQLFLGLFYGLLFLAGIIYLFFYTSLKEKSFLYYGLYVFSIAFMQAALDGLIFQYIFPGGGFLMIGQ